MLYELLKIVEEQKLYRREDPISKTPGYPSFKAFFEASLKESFEQWAEWEAAYRVVTRNSPNFFEKIAPEAS